MIPEATPEPPIPPIQPGTIAAKVMRILEERDGRALEAAPLPTAKNGPRRPWYEERAINLNGHDDTFMDDDEIWLDAAVGPAATDEHRQRGESDTCRLECAV